MPELNQERAASFAQRMVGAGYDARLARLLSPWGIDGPSAG